ncbi:MAG: ABC transporter permease [Tannerella sp.]|jgi:putative ABC transport system permease protein|nr:ABC transporter permease [Tannerella sp.]
MNFKSFFKFLSRNKGYTAIDIFGLSVSLMFVILIGVYVQQELSTDKFQKNAERIYALGSEQAVASAWRLGTRLESRYPEIETVCPVISSFRGEAVLIGDTHWKADLMFSDSSFFHVFSFRLLQGDPQTALIGKENAVISEAFARKVFSGRNPMGQRIRLNDSVTVVVNGIMQDIKRSTLPSIDILVNINNVRFYNPSLDTEHFNNAAGCDLFILAKKGADLPAKKDDMLKYFKDIFWIYQLGSWTQVTLTPLSKLHFTDLAFANPLNHGDWKFVLTLLSVGILILLFAVINYINLTVAQAGQRAKEMATRRLLGSSRADLFRRLMLESTLLTFFSFLIGLLLAVAAAPLAADLLQTKVDLLGAFRPLNVGIALLLILGIGALSGLLPALVISNSKPIDIVRGGFRRKTKMVFSKVFITFQNVITIMMLAASLTMALQIYHMIPAPMGFNTPTLMDISTGQFDTEKDARSFGNEIGQLASVKRVGYSAGMPTSSVNNNTTQNKRLNKTISFMQLWGDSTWFRMLNFKVLRDNHVASPDAWYLTQEAMRQLELPDSAQSFDGFRNSQPIAGILRDFKLYTVNRKPEAIVVKIKNDVLPWDILVEVQGDPMTAYKQISEVYKRMTGGLEFEGKFLDQQIASRFESELRTTKIVTIFCGMAILLSLLGLLAMSTYFIRQRSTEIAVRKVFGSTNREMLRRLVRTFLSYVGIAFILATPPVWYIMHRWISAYTYRIPLYWWIFLAAGLFCLLVAFATVFWQSYRAANSNPAVKLKIEN